MPISQNFWVFCTMILSKQTGFSKFVLKLLDHYMMLYLTNLVVLVMLIWILFAEHWEYCFIVHPNIILISSLIPLPIKPKPSIKTLKVTTVCKISSAFLKIQQSVSSELFYFIYIYISVNSRNFLLHISNPNPGIFLCHKPTWNPIVGSFTKFSC